MTPWSVRPSAGWSNWAARAARPSILQAPSSSEYSEWTWRCTAGAKVGRLWGRDPTEPGRVEAKARSFRDSELGSQDAARAGAGRGRGGRQLGRDRVAASARLPLRA